MVVMMGMCYSTKKCVRTVGANYRRIPAITIFMIYTARFKQNTCNSEGSQIILC